MKNLIIVLVLSLPLGVGAQIRSGINTKSPDGTLHITPNGTDEPLRIEGIKPGSGSYLMVDDAGYLKFTTVRQNLAFVLPAVNSPGPLVLTTASETGEHVYNENSSPNGSIAGQSWSKIPGLESTFSIIESVNAISVNVEGITYYSSLSPMPNDSSISFAIGVFLDGKLIAMGNYNLKSTQFAYQAKQWNLMAAARNLSKGTHKIEVYATRRITTGDATAPINVGGQGADAGPNQFMAKGILQVSGVYN